jgi:membrane-associated PAP2 superfamily phosphatase
MNPLTALYPSRLFWRNHAAWPLFAFVIAFGLVEGLGLDRWIAGSLYFDAGTGHWLGTGAGDWWAHALLHDDGRWLVRGVAAVALVLWAASFLAPALRPIRRRAGFVALSMVIATALVGGLKAITNVDCPWDLAGYGGHNPYVPLFADRPDYLPRARCFPGAHASSGFALLALYFEWRDTAPARARLLMLVAISLGCLFAVGQEARGAHFFSHDLAAAAIVWFVQLGLYAWLLKPGLAADDDTVKLRRPREYSLESGTESGLG